MDTAETIDFCTLGMFIIDEIHPPKDAINKKPQYNVIGGAGTYSAIGARLFSPPPLSSTVGWIVDEGSDFPEEVRCIINSWQTGLVLRKRDGLTTRGWNGYGDNDYRSFRYLTPKLRLTADDLTPSLLRSKSFHLICSADRCIELVDRIIERRGQTPRPLFIWEPVPDLCTSVEMNAIKRALRKIDVISPNHDELAALFNYKHQDNLDKTVVEQQAEALLQAGIGGEEQRAVVVRCGREGCFVANSHHKTWLPAVFREQSRVIDPTGGGNGFLGGFAVGLVRTGDIIKAAQFGAVAASFCIEQVGLPQLSGSGNNEIWNGSDVFRRMEDWKKCFTSPT